LSALVLGTALSLFVLYKKNDRFRDFVQKKISRGGASYEKVNLVDGEGDAFDIGEEGSDL